MRRHLGGLPSLGGKVLNSDGVSRLGTGHDVADVETAFDDVARSEQYDGQALRAVADDAHRSALLEGCGAPDPGDPGQSVPHGGGGVEDGIKMVVARRPHGVQGKEAGEVDPDIGQPRAVGGARQTSAKAQAIDRVAWGADQPVTESHTGNLRVTMQLMRRELRLDRLLVARMRTASRVTWP